MAGPLNCPRCGAQLADTQDWCLSCGHAARTRIVSTPSWRGPLALATALATISAIALVIAFVNLTRDDPAPTAYPIPVIQTVTAPPATTAAPPADSK